MNASPSGNTSHTVTLRAATFPLPERIVIVNRTVPPPCTWLRFASLSGVTAGGRGAGGLGGVGGVGVGGVGVGGVGVGGVGVGGVGVGGVGVGGVGVGGVGVGGVGAQPGAMVMVWAWVAVRVGSVESTTVTVKL